MTGGKRPSTSGLRRRLRRRNVASMVSNEIIFLELEGFLERHFGRRNARRVLDLGAGARPYAPLYRPYFRSSTSADVAYSPHDIGGIDAIAPAEDLPFETGSFECVICTEALEHCRSPAEAMGEISRVLQPGGRAFITTPFLRPLHEMPHDYYRYTPSALRDLSESSGLAITGIVPRGDYVAVALLTFQLPLTKLLQRISRRVGAGRYGYSNPLVYLTVAAPQLCYLAAWRSLRAHPSAGLARLYARSTYYTLGYVTTVVKPDGRAC
jgi:SAM-dependent methyltransferase